VPKLKIKSVNLKEVKLAEPLIFTIEISDKEGDFTSYFGFKKTVPGCAASQFIDSLKLVIPSEFISSGEKSGDIRLVMDRSVRGDNQCRGTGSTFKNDTVTFRFWTKDKAGNVSDTAVSDPIVLIAQ
jgi:hypothetical protein